MTRPARGAVVAAAGLLASIGMTACTSRSGAAHRASGAPAGVAATGAATHAVATRWWSNDAVRAGSTIDVHDPTAAVGKLHASRPEYCTMLRQTVAAGKSILPGVSATDPALLASTKAFVGEIRMLAPSEIRGAWKTFGDAVLTLVESGAGSAELTGLDAGQVRRATAAVAADAKARCSVDLGGKLAR